MSESTEPDVPVVEPDEMEDDGEEIPEEGLEIEHGEEPTQGL